MRSNAPSAPPQYLQALATAILCIAVISTYASRTPHQASVSKMQYSLQVELLMELLRQLGQGVNADAGGLRKNPASACACKEMVAGGSNTVRVGA